MERRLGDQLGRTNSRLPEGYKNSEAILGERMIFGVWISLLVNFLIVLKAHALATSIVTLNSANAGPSENAIKATGKTE